jgi:cobalt-zinc-cadmium efflux system protein
VTDDHEHHGKSADADHAGHGHGHGHDHAGLVDHSDADHSDAGHGRTGHADTDHVGHDHGGHHHAPPDRMTRAFAIAIVLNIVFVVIGVIAGFAANSTALLADAAHNLGDVLGLGLAWGAMALARRARTARRTYGYRRTTILATLANGGLVLFAIGGVVWEAIERLGATPPVDGRVVAIVAAIGIVLNGGAAMLFAKGREHDMNVRGAYLHLMADAAVSAGVVVAGLIVWRTGWAWVDPATSLVVSGVILFGTWQLLREAMGLLMDAVPAHVDPAAVDAYLASLPEVGGVHDLHIWSMSTTEVALTAHLIVPSWDECSPRLLVDVAAELKRRFKIGHVTIQLEPLNQPVDCKQAADGAI